MTGPVRLDVDAGRQVSGVVMYAPVYRFGTPATRSARRAALPGWIYAPLDMQAFVDAALRAARGHASLTIRDRGGEGHGAEMGRAPWRERVCQSGAFSVGDGTLKKTKT